MVIPVGNHYFISDTTGNANGETEERQRVDTEEETEGRDKVGTQRRET